MHQSPRSSAELVPLMHILAPHFLVIAPDTPGFGLSDPIEPPDHEPTIDAFVDALAAFLDAIGLERPALYGTHTGAIIAVRFASRYPDRVAALVANGVLLTTADERAEQAEFGFPRLLPAWDGSHLAWLWTRLRDQLVFYPWYRRDPAHRIDWQQTLEEIDAGALDLLEAGDNYRSAYRAVLDYDIAEDLSLLAVPTLLLVARTDALHRYVADYPSLPPHVEVSVVPDFPDVPAATLNWLKARALPSAHLLQNGTPGRYGLRSSFVNLGDGGIHVRTNAARAGTPIMALHDLGGSAAGLEAILRGMGNARPIYAPDLPGNGDSDSFGATTPAEIAQLILRLADALRAGPVDLVAIGASAAIALALRRLAPDRIGRVVLADPLMAPTSNGVDFASRWLPDLSPEISGSHLLRGWAFLRDRALFHPWHDRSPDAATPLVRPPRPVELQRGLVDLLKARPVFAAQFAAALAEGTAAKIAAANVIPLAAAGSPARRSELRFDPLPDEPLQWGPVLFRTLSR